MALFRLPLAAPHLVWLALWTAVAVPVGLANWLATLILGRPPNPLRVFLVAYVRYVTHAIAFVVLAANPFPGFVGKAGTYPIDLEVDPPAAVRRWKTLVRLILLYPTFLLFQIPLRLITFVVYPLIFLYALVTSLVLGRVTEGGRNLAVYVIRYEVQEFAYLLCITPRFPYAGPFYGTPRYV